MDKNEQSKELVVHSLETFQQLALGFIPAGHVFDAFLNFRANLKQKRVIAFAESVYNSLEEITGVEISANNFTTEDLVDVMEIIMFKVQSTRSDYKLEKYRDILVRQIVNPEDFSDSVNYINILNELSEIEIILLEKLNYSKEFALGLPRKIRGNLAKEKQENEKGFLALDIGNKTVEIDYPNLEFHMNSLIRLGLIKLNEVTHTRLSGRQVRNRSMDYYTVSVSGERLLNFIKR